MALLLSLIALKSARNQQRRDAFVRTQEFLLAADLQAGRRAIFAADRAGALPADDDVLELILRSLGAFNTVAEMSRRRAIDEAWVLDAWHHHLRGMRVVFESALAYRAQWHDFNPWSDLDHLIEAAENYESDRECCHGPTLTQRAATSRHRLLVRP
jgi:hypothetical protein